MSPAQRAALLLAGFQAADRDDVLARLPAPLRERIALRLDEVLAMGAAPGHDWLSLVDEQPGPRVPPPLELAIDTLHDASAESMGRVLAGEPVSVAVAIIAAGDWPWRDSFLAACSAERRAAIEARVETRSLLPEPVWQRLLEQVARRVRQTGAIDSAFEATLVREEDQATPAGWRSAWAR